MRGRGNPGRQWRLALKHLSCYRLSRIMSTNEGIHLFLEQNPKLVPYRNPQDWENAKRKAKEIIETFENPPPEEIISKRFLDAFDPDYPKDLPEI
jgi:hypothetical protein